jgi:hypothetical protein
LDELLEMENYSAERREIAMEAADDQARKELGANYPLVEIGEAATVDRLLQDLAVEERLDAMIDKCLKRLLHLSEEFATSVRITAAAARLRNSLRAWNALPNQLSPEQEKPAFGPDFRGTKGVHTCWHQDKRGASFPALIPLRPASLEYSYVRRIPH